MRTFGVEEEFLLVDPADGTPLPLGQAVFDLGVDDRITREIKQEQIETGTRPHDNARDLALDVAHCRAMTDNAAMRAGARAAALATSPRPALPACTRGTRYEEMDLRFAITSKEQLTCGCHVHVSVEDDDEGVAVLDRIRVWLPVLIALSSNSPFWNGTDTGYSSYRWQAWSRWPMAGPSEVFGTAENYHALVESLLDCAVPLDLGQIYFDARLSHNHPTVEIRVGDVCLYSDDAVLLALLTRGLVETAAREWRRGIPPRPMPAAKLRLAYWRASRFGMDDNLLHPVTDVPQDASTVALALLRYVRPALADMGDAEITESLLRQVIARGTGCHRQRASLQCGDLSDVVSDAVRITNLARGSIAEFPEAAPRDVRPQPLARIAHNYSDWS
ncbi:glutamate--cysteine ligase [Arthrobacter sp. Z1-15]